MAKQIEVLNMNQFALRIGVSVQAVRKYIDTKKITESALQRNAKGVPSILLEKALADLKKNQDPTKVRRTRTGLNIGGSASMQHRTEAPDREEIEKIANSAKVSQNGRVELPDGTMTDMNADPESYGEAKIKGEIAKAITLMLGMKKLRGELVSREEVDLQLANLAVALRSDLQNIPDRIAAACAVETSMVTIRSLIAKEIESVLLKHSGKLTKKHDS